MTGTDLAATRVILHLDDVGMCHGANTAFVELSRLGTIDCGSVMVPCPWYSEMAQCARSDPSLDLGVHLTLTAEKAHYRWRPLTGVSRTGGLTDPDGFFWRDVANLRAHADPQAADYELRAQIETARSAGIDITHLDAHMGAVLAPEFVDLYISLGADYDVPIVFPRSIQTYGPSHNFGTLDDAPYRARAAVLASAGLPVADRVLETPWHVDRPATARYGEMLRKIGAGFTFVALHANAPGELEAIEPDSARIRIDEWDLFRDPDFRVLLDALPGRTSMRAVRDAMRRDGTGAPGAPRRDEVGFSDISMEEGTCSS